MRKFSSVVTSQRGDGWLELRYDDRISVVLALGPQVASAAAGSPLGEPAAGVLHLQGTGVASVSCPDPDCIKGIPPLQKQPEPGVFWMALPKAATIAPSDGWPSCLIVPGTGTGASIAIPIFGAGPGTEWRGGDELTKYRQRINQADDPVAFHVYLISVARDSLAALQNKRIALPIPCELVKADRLERIRLERIRSTG